MAVAEPLSLLWVDDQPETIRGASDWLLAQGHEVVFAPTPEEAVDQFADQVFHLAMIDVCLVDRDGHPASGFDLAERLRAEGDVPFVFVTAHRAHLDGPASAGHAEILYKAGDLVTALSRLLHRVPRPDLRVTRLVSIAQRLKRERDQARRERDISNAASEVWLASLWPDNHDEE